MRTLSFLTLTTFTLLSLSEGARWQRIISAEDYERVAEDFDLGPSTGDTGPVGNSRNNAGRRRTGARPSQGVGNRRVIPSFRGTIVQGRPGRPNETEAEQQERIEPLSLDEIEEEFPWITRPRQSQRTAERRWKVRDLTTLRDSLGLGRRSKMRAVRGRSGHGRFLIRIEQLWSEVPVYSTVVTAEQNDYGELYTDNLDGELLVGIDEDLNNATASYDEREALYIALRIINHSFKDIENPRIVKYIYNDNGTAILTYLVNWYAPESDYNGSELTRKNERERFRRKIFDTAEAAQTTTTTTTTTTPTPTTLRSGSNNKGRRAGSNRYFSPGQWAALGSGYSLNGVRVVSPFVSTVSEDRDLPGLPEILTTSAAPPAPLRANPIPQQDWVDESVPSRPYVLLNAHTGELIFTYDGLTSVLSARQLIVGNDKISRTSSINLVSRTSSLCLHESPMTSAADGPKVKIFDAFQRFGTQVPCNKLNDPDFDAVPGAVSPRNSALDAAFFTVKSLKTITLSNFPTIGDLRVEVHHNGYQALYTGLRILLGNGWEDRLYPQTTLDIVAHEVAHAFTAGPGMSNLAMTGDSGAINEAFSDITAAAMMDLKGFSNEYLMGSQITVGWRAIRDMCNPNVADLLSFEPLDRAPVNYQQYQAKRDSDHHRDSSLFSLFFCRLSKRANWGIQDTYNIFISANMIYWSQNIEYPAAACALVKATRFEFNNAQSRVDDVKAELANIGLGCESEAIPDP